MSAADKDKINKDHLYVPRAGDVLINGPAKAGTTWLQQILHQIRTKGDESFNDIYDITWFIQFPKFADRFNFNDEQVCNPRIYKCHYTFEDTPKNDGVKHVFIARNPHDCAYSFAKFLHRLWGTDEDVDDETMMFYLEKQGTTTGRDSCLFLSSWWPHRKDPNVYWVYYEDLLENLELITKELADFIDMPLTDNELKRVCSLCTFDYMSTNGDKFKANPVAELFALSLDQEKWPVTSSMVRKDGGRSGEGKEKLASSLKELVDDQWKEIVTKQLGFKNYDEMYLEGTRLAKI